MLKFFMTVKLCIVALMVLMSTVVIAEEAVATVSEDKEAVYQSGIDGMIMLKNIAFAFFTQLGKMPTTQELLETRLQGLSSVGKDLLKSHYIQLIYVDPTSSSSCQGIFLQGTIYDSSKVAPGTDINNFLSLMNNVYLMNANGAWYTICSYQEVGPKAESANLHLKNCYNMTIPEEKAKLETQINSILSNAPQCKSLM